jgi:glycosyltransferase involved in cell wall biosynthesis
MWIDTTSVLHKLKTSTFNKNDLNVVAPSNWMEQKITQSNLEVDSLHCVYNGIDLNKFYPRGKVHSRDSFGITDRSAVILFAANNIDNPQKGMPYLLSAIDQLSEVDNIPEILIIGGNTSILKQIPERYEYYAPGYIPEEKLPLAYSAADLFVVPYKMESFGLVATESMACGTPVIAFNVGGLKEQITDATGWLVPPYDTKQLATTIETALSDPEVLKNKGERSRERVAQNYSIDRCVDGYHSIYERLLAQ